MRIFTFATAAVFVLSCSAYAQKSHTVTKGQTLSHIAAKYGVSQSAILQSNKLSSAHKLKLGQKLRIPQASKSLNSGSGRTVAKNSARNQGGGYTVRNGDHDSAVARKHGISVEQLHRLNPNVNWRKLQIGQKLNVPGSRASSSAKLASSTKVKAGGAYSVQKNDNDWIIARRVGTTPSKLRAVNPGVKWTALQIGQKIRVPGTSSSTGRAILASAGSIKTRHALIAKDDVAVRKNPSTNSSKITQVGKGTYVTVLDRDSGWYKLKFPKGTVGWVRGDMLKPLQAKAVARATTRSRRSNYVAAKPDTKKYAFSTSKSLAVLDFASSMLGVRYRYGSSSRSATDCSGMVLQAFRSVGIKLPRTSREMSKVGASVPKSQLKPGDLVFFKTRGSRISHVGIYHGSGKFIHASSSGGSVRIDSINDGYYSRRFAGAKRVTKHPAPSKSTIVVKNDDHEEQERLLKEKAAVKGESEPAFAEPAPSVVSKPQATDDISR